MERKLSLLIITVLLSTTMFAQNNPYEIFGYEDKSIVNRNEQVIPTYIEFFNDDSTSLIDKVHLNIYKGIAIFYSKQGDILLEKEIPRNIFARWLTTDPKHQYHSPYLGMGNNPIKRIDPDGGDDFYFDGSGNLLSDKTVTRSGFYNFLFGHSANVLDADGNVMERFSLSKQGYGVVTSTDFEGFNYQWQTDGSANGFETKVNNAISGYGKDGRGLYEYIVYHSQDRDGRLMNQKTTMNRNMIYGFEGRAYNVNEAGNIVWGAAMYVFGHAPGTTWRCAHGGTLMAKKRFDEADEAAATFRGADYMYRHPQLTSPMRQNIGLGY